MSARGALGLLVLLLAAPAWAANPPCGATLTGLTVLTGPMTCQATALHLTSNATLDCAGFTITGPDLPPASCNPAGPSCVTDHYGLRIAARSGVTIRNCQLTHFERGVYASGAQQLLIVDTVAHNNTRYGFGITDSTGTLLRTRASQNRDEGYHLEASPLQITSATADLNVAEGFYLLDTLGAVLTTPSARSNGQAGIYVKNSPGTEVTAPRLVANPLHVVAGSTLQLVAPTPTSRDFNGDGLSDILWRGPAGVVYVWFMNGGTKIGEAVIDTVHPSWAIVNVQDYDGDGKADLLWRHTSGATTLWLMNGATVRETIPFGIIGTDWTVVP